MSICLRSSNWYHHQLAYDVRNIGKQTAGLYFPQRCKWNHQENKHLTVSDFTSSMAARSS